MIFLTVLQQIVILFVLIAIGFVLTKRNIATEKGAASATDCVLLLITPCVIIQSFERPFDRSTLHMILWSFLAAFATQTAFILVSRLLFRNEPEARRRVLRFAVVFTNCGFMSLPLQQAVLGDDGVLYGASYIAIFNLLAWSYGLIDMSGDRKMLSPRKLFLNPGILGLAAGLVIFLFSVRLPKVISAPIGYLAALNTPVPMLIIGYHLAQSDLREALRDRKCLAGVFIRLAAFPAGTLALLWLCGARGELLVSTVISCSAPTAAITTMFSAKYRQATDLSVNMVSLSTAFSLLTMPVFITLAQYLSRM